MNIEKIGIFSSIVGAGIMAIYGLTMAYFTKSESILLDGSFNLLSVLLSTGSLVISFFVDKGYTKNHPMGFFAYESFIIFVKGIFILGLVIMSFHSNLTSLLSGGREPNIEGMLWYAYPGLAINLVTLTACYFSYKKSQTGLLYAEYKSWELNTLITAVIAAAITVVYFMQGTSWSWLDRYIDQLLVVAVCVLTINDPIKIIKNSFGELMLKSRTLITKNLEEWIQEQCGKDFHLEDVLIMKVGRGTFITVDLTIKAKDISMSSYLQLKQKIDDKFKMEYSNSDIVYNLYESPIL